MNHEHWLELADIHALGALDGEDLISFQQHLGTDCAECRAHLAETEALLAALPSTLAVITPPAQLKEVLMGQIHDPLAVPVPAKPAMLGPIMIGSAVLAAAAVVWIALPVMRPAPEPEIVPAAASVMPHDAAMTSLLENPDVKIIEFKDPATNQKMLAKLYWSPGACGGCFTVEGLSKTEAGKVYEFWAITGDTPVPGGTFTIGEDGKAHLDIRSMGDIKNFEKFAVTIEPEGGTPLPTGPMKLLSF